MDALRILISGKLTHGKRTHSYGRDQELRILNQSGFKYLEYGTHLTIYISDRVHRDSTNYHAHETSYARDGVNLLNE